MGFEERLTRRGLLIGGGAAVGGLFLYCSRPENQTNLQPIQTPETTQKEPNLNPDTAGRPFAQAALERNFDKMLELVAPDMRSFYKTAFTRQGLEDFLGIYTCSTGKLTKDPAIVRYDGNNVEKPYYATYSITGECQRKSYPNLPPIKVQEVTVVLEKVIEGGREKYYPKRMR